MLLQTNSYIVPKERRAEHARLIRRFRQALARVGCDQFDIYEQIGANWDPSGANGRYVQLMRFRDYQHQQEVQTAEREDAGAQAIIAEFCALINFPYQQQHGYFATGFYTSVLPVGPQTLERAAPMLEVEDEPAADVSAIQQEPEAEVSSIEPPAKLPEPAAAEPAIVTPEPAAFAEIPISDALPTELPAIADVPLTEAPIVPDAPVADELPTDPPTIADVRITEAPIVANEDAPDEDFDLLDLSTIELTDDEMALHDQLGSDLDVPAGHNPPHEASAHEPVGSAVADAEPVQNRIMLDATLPEEDDFSTLLDDRNLREHAAPPENGKPAPIASDNHDAGDLNGSRTQILKDDELLEFDAFLRDLKDGSAEHG